MQASALMYSKVKPDGINWIQKFFPDVLLEQLPKNTAAAIWGKKGLRKDTFKLQGV